MISNDDTKCRNVFITRLAFAVSKDLHLNTYSGSITTALSFLSVCPKTHVAWASNTGHEIQDLPAPQLQHVMCGANQRLLAAAGFILRRMKRLESRAPRRPSGFAICIVRGLKWSEGVVPTTLSLKGPTVSYLAAVDPAWPFFASNPSSSRSNICKTDAPTARRPGGAWFGSGGYRP